MKSYVFRVELEEEDGRWSAVIPALPGCVVEEATAEEALVSIREVAQAFVEIMIEDGDSIPEDDSVIQVIDGPAVSVIT